MGLKNQMQCVVHGSIHGRKYCCYYCIRSRLTLWENKRLKFHNFLVLARVVIYVIIYISDKIVAFRYIVLQNRD